ncbi:hypothetical protein L3Y34_019320 [Caenorhabditis briggsae]|uniref:Uncharacterized protein n=1 Tax=Caenorhabditis briggsae TaxID=6238 RepID=A0AAE9DPJ5_CAEBR|nr:hypothetical protein L3Y34_019320 [Caenorhabditis briggsae]
MGHQKASAQGYQQGLAENSRLLVYFEKKATKLMCRLSEYEIINEDLFTGDISMGSNEEGVADRGSEEEPDARADQWSLIKSTISMVNAMKDKMGYGEAQEGVEEDQVT